MLRKRVGQIRSFYFVMPHIQDKSREVLDARREKCVSLAVLTGHGTWP